MHFAAVRVWGFCGFAKGVPQITYGKSEPFCRVRAVAAVGGRGVVGHAGRDRDGRPPDDQRARDGGRGRRSSSLRASTSGT